MTMSEQILLVYLRNRLLVVSLMGIFLITGLIVSISVSTLYESSPVVEIGKNVRMGQVYFASGVGENLDDELRIYVDSPRYVEDATRVASRLIGRYGDTAPFFRRPKAPFVADASDIYRWDETVRVKVRAATAEEAVAFSRKVLNEILTEHNEIVSKNREAVSHLLELTRQEKEVVEGMDPSPNRVIKRILVEERIARLSQQLDEMIRDSIVTISPESTVERVRPKPMVYLLVSIFCSVILTAVVVIFLEWVKSLRASFGTFRRVR